MDKFLSQVEDFYFNMAENGRAASFEFKVKNGSSMYMDSQVGDCLLSEVIEDLLYDNSVDGTGIEQAQSGRTFLLFNSVHIPLTGDIRGHNRKQSAFDVAQRIATELKKRYGINATCKRVGLGRVEIYLASNKP